MKRKTVYTDAPPEVSAAIARGRIISREEAGIPPAEFFRTATEIMTTENGITTVGYIPSPEYLESQEWKKYQEYQEAKKVREARVKLKPQDDNISVKSAFGLWKDRDIDVNSLRRKAWTRV